MRDNKNIRWRSVSLLAVLATAGLACWAASARGGDHYPYPDLEQRLRASENAMRVAAIGEAAELDDGERAVSLLGRALLNDHYHPARGLAASALGRLGGPAAVDVLLEALARERDHRPRWMIIEALGEAGDRRAVEPLLPFVESDDAAIRAVSASSLGLLGDARARAALRKAFLDPDPVVRVFAEWALKQVGG